MNSDEAPLRRTEAPFHIPDLFKFGEIFEISENIFWTACSGIRSDYEIPAGAESRKISVFSICSEDEKIIFRAFQDWFAGAIRKFSAGAPGYWTLEVLKFTVQDVPRSWDEFALLLINHASKMMAGERRLIQFGTLFGVLHLRTPADTGKTEARLSLDFWKAGPDVFARKIQKQKAESGGSILIRDISRTPLCAAEEIEALKDLLKGRNLPPSWYFHENSGRLHSIA